MKIGPSFADHKLVFLGGSTPQKLSWNLYQNAPLLKNFRYILSRATSLGLPSLRWREDIGGGLPNARESRIG